MRMSHHITTRVAIERPIVHRRRCSPLRMSKNPRMDLRTRVILLVPAIDARHAPTVSQWPQVDGHFRGLRRTIFNERDASGEEATGRLVGYRNTPPAGFE